MININLTAPVDFEEWRKAQEWEREWHDNCANSFNEEAKQFTYANRMGLDEFKGYDRGGRVNWNYGDKTVLDIGGGAYSMLLKSQASKRTVVDPCNYPDWVRARYAECGIRFITATGEQLSSEHLPDVTDKSKKYDIALIYNCLQHTIDPQKIIENARKLANEIRIFEWVETGVSDGHLHNLKAELLDLWLGGQGKVEDISEGGCIGKCYYGIFPTGVSETVENIVKAGEIINSQAKSLV